MQDNLLEELKKNETKLVLENELSILKPRTETEKE